MEEYLYRFRPVKRLLDSEIDKLSIYFATPDQLNDPLEGTKNIFWKGDSIVWKNLFKHYIRCIVIKYHDIANDKFSPNIPTTLDWASLTDKIKQVEHHAISLFLADTITNKFIETLATTERKIHQEELLAFLYVSHHFALHCCELAHSKLGTLPFKSNMDDAFLAYREKQLNALIGQLNLLAHVPPDANEMIRNGYEEMISTAEQINLFDKYKNQKNDTDTHEAVDFLKYHFPRQYVKSLEQLMYPDWYVACFMSACDNSSIWGTYGKDHKGVCLKFKTIERDDLPFIKLTPPSTYPDANQLLQLDLKKVNYDPAFREYSFFECIANIPRRMSLEDWYTYEGESSPIQAWMDSDKFSIEDYNKTFNNTNTEKLDSWKHENEYRILLTSFADISSPVNRAFSYDFSSLDGVIFGIKTTLEDKIAIIEKFSSHIERTQRTDFNFYQAHFDRKTNTIQHKKLEFFTTLLVSFRAQKS